MTKTKLLLDRSSNGSVPLNGIPMDLMEEMIREDMDLDLPPSQNFGTFSTTKLDPAIHRLVLRALIEIKPVSRRIPL